MVTDLEYYQLLAVLADAGCLDGAGGGKPFPWPQEPTPEEPTPEEPVCPAMPRPQSASQEVRRGPRIRFSFRSIRQMRPSAAKSRAPPKGSPLRRMATATNSRALTSLDLVTDDGTGLICDEPDLFCDEQLMSGPNYLRPPPPPPKRGQWQEGRGWYCPKDGCGRYSVRSFKVCPNTSCSHVGPSIPIRHRHKRKRAE